MADHQAAVHADLLGEERRQTLAAGVVEHAVHTPLGDRTHLGDRDGQEVCCETQRGAVKVAAGLDPAVAHDHGVVDGRRKLGLGHRGAVGQGVAYCTVYRRRATN